MDQKQTYKAKVYCKNCDFSGEIEIPKGQVIDDTPCTNCDTCNLIKNQDITIQNDSFPNL